MLILKNISYSIAGKNILKSVSCEFHARMLSVILGPSGAGKTTLARIVKGFIHQDSGEIIFPRGDVKDIQKRMGFVFQFPEDAFFAETVYDEIAYGIRNFGLDEEKKRVKEAVHLVGLSQEILNRDPATLSYGEKRRIAISSVVVFNPDWIMFDEPFSGLDWQGKNAMKKILMNMKGKTSIIVITHDLSPLVDIFDWIVLMNRGTTIFSLPAEKILWDEVETSGVNIPFHIKVGMELKKENLFHNVPLTLSEFVKEIKGLSR